VAADRHDVTEHPFLHASDNHLVVRWDVQNGSSVRPCEGWPHSVTAGALPSGLCEASRGNRRRRRYLRGNAGSLRGLLGRESERFGMGTTVLLSQDLTEPQSTGHLGLIPACQNEKVPSELG
jgi:hypothetical protein